MFCLPHTTPSPPLLVVLVHRFEMVCSVVPQKHQKLLAHIKKCTERQKRKRAREDSEGVQVRTYLLWGDESLVLLHMTEEEWIYQTANKVNTVAQPSHVVVCDNVCQF